jgi:hypothetical protein
MQMVLEAARGLASAPPPRPAPDADLPPPSEGWAASSFDPAAAAAAAASALDAAATALRPTDTPQGLTSLSHLVRLLSRLLEVDAPELRATLNLALRSLPAAHYGAFPPDVDALLRRVTELDHKPAKVHLAVTSLGLGLEPDAALATIVSAVEEVGPETILPRPRLLLPCYPLHRPPPSHCITPSPPCARLSCRGGANRKGCSPSPLPPQYHRITPHHPPPRYCALWSQASSRQWRRCDKKTRSPPPLADPHSPLASTSHASSHFRLCDNPPSGINPPPAWHLQPLSRP